MNKIILTICLLLFLNCFANPIETSFNLPSKESTSYINLITKNSDNIKGTAVILTALELIRTSPFTETYEIITGKNPTQKPIIIEYQNLSLIDPMYKNYDALGWKKKKQLFIYINNKHYNAPPEAIAALIAGRTANIDTATSINEELYCWCIEGAFWTYFTLKNPELQNNNQSLVKRENVIKKLLEKGNYTEAYIEKFILSNKGYANYQKTSPGYSDEELKQKLSKLFKNFNLVNQ